MALERAAGTYKLIPFVEDSDNPGVFVVEINHDGGNVILESLKGIADRLYNEMIDLGNTGNSLSTDIDDGNAFMCVATDNFDLEAPTGTPYDGQRVTWRITQDGGGGNTITLNAVFNEGDDITVTLSAAGGATDYMAAIWNEASSKWDVVAFVKGY